MKDVNLIEPAHELTTRARPSSSSARLQTEPSRAGSFTTEPISSRAFFERVSSEMRATSFLNTPRLHCESLAVPKLF
ncbi:hypothetical protein HanIR_Chr01g0035111 [Helianthus annuus]|nr:hypothetical protein HanIR_Chr01g0035111 [Helianthus annuus]